MLVLSRRVGQRLVIPSLGVSIIVTRVDGHNVRLGIEAPDHVKVFRSELLPAPPEVPALVAEDGREG